LSSNADDKENGDFVAVQDDLLFQRLRPSGSDISVWGFQRQGYRGTFYKERWSILLPLVLRHFALRCCRENVHGGRLGEEAEVLFLIRTSLDSKPPAVIGRLGEIT
jgi:hypothetical protein